MAASARRRQRPRPGPADVLGRNDGRRRRRHGRRPRPPVRHHAEPGLFPRPRRDADRLADVRRAQRRAGLSPRPAHRAGPLQLQPGLHLPAEAHQHPGPLGAALYPTIEVAPTTPATDAYLSHNAIPIQFTDEDFQQVLDGGNFVTKVIYLPDPQYQELAVSGVETLVSTRLEPGIDPILEADKRGTILLIVRLGAIDLEMPGGGPMTPGGGPAMGPGPAGGGGGVMTSPMPYSGPVTELPPAALPPGMTPNQPAAPGTVVLDPQPTDAVAPPVVPPATPAPAPQPAAPLANPRPSAAASYAQPAVAAVPPGMEPPAVLAPASEPPVSEAPPATPRP